MLNCWFRSKRFKSRWRRQKHLNVSVEKFCVQCQVFLRGESRKSADGTFVLHPERRSFEEALQLPCSFCSLLWGALQRSGVTELNTTTFIRAHRYDPDPEVRELCVLLFSFYCDSGHTTLSMVPWGSMSGYRYPVSLSHSTCGKDALEFLLAKYSECSREHPECKPQFFDQNWLPHRVLDVREVEGDTICLRDSQELSERGAYFTLSHCWGDYQPISLTKQTETLLRSGLQVRELPKTFQDAVLIARKFDVRYLWIDSLCIFQDDNLDWSIEARDMCDVYGRAACGIAATAAEDSSVGLFFDRDPILLQPVRIQTSCISNEISGPFWVDGDGLWREVVEKSPLNQRAWVAQERQLSPRIMHFGANQLFWECNRNMASEVYPSGLPLWTQLPFLDRQRLKKTMSNYRKQLFNGRSGNTSSGTKAVTNSQDLVDELYNTWHLYLASYTTCQMTKEEDKLVALSGIARAVGELLGDELVAGLWKSRLLEELCWSRQVGARICSGPLQWRAPSWSWASTEHGVRPLYSFENHRLCQEREMLVTLHQLMVVPKISGQLERASISLSCRPISARIRKQSKLANLWRDLTIDFMEDEVIDWPVDESMVYRITPDEADVEKLQDGWKVHLVVILKCFHHKRESDHEYKGDFVEGIFIIPHEDGSGTFKRVGHFAILHRPAIDIILAKYDESDRKIVELI